MKYQSGKPLKLFMLILAITFVSIPLVTSLATTDDIMAYLGTIEEKLNLTEEQLNATDANVSLMRGDVGTISTNTNQTNIIYTFLLLFALVLFVISRMINDFAFSMIAGFVMCITAIFSAQYGFYNFESSFLNTAIIIIFAGIGFYLIIKSGLDWINEGWGVA